VSHRVPHHVSRRLQDHVKHQRVYLRFERQRSCEYVPGDNGSCVSYLFDESNRLYTIAGRSYLSRRLYRLYISVMTGTPALRKGEPPEFRLVGGEPSLDFANTAEWNGDELLVEKLPDYESLVRWAHAAGVIDARVARKLRSHARRSRDDAERALAGARDLRGILHRTFRASVLMQGRARVSAGLNDSVAALGDLLHDALKHRRIGAERGRVRLYWNGMGDRLDCIEWPIIWNAVQVLASESVDSMRICAGKDCGWLYVDRSRNGLRRWCSMETCGSREKAHRHYVRVTQRKHARRS
jgi:predicted RNA-binding Zn ribbon-like protein